jgi:hypothetical protein
VAKPGNPAKEGGRQLFTDPSFDLLRHLVTMKRHMRQAIALPAIGLPEGSGPMQAMREMNRNAQRSPFFDPKASKLPEYVYRAAILVAVILLLWTAV